MEYVRKLCNLPGNDMNAGNPLGWAADLNKKDIMEILAENPNLEWNNGYEIDFFPITEALNFLCDDSVEYLLQQTLVDSSTVPSAVVQRSHDGQSARL